MEEKINLKEDRDFFTREFRKNVDLLNESTGNYIWTLLLSLEKEINHLDIDDKKKKQMTFALDKLERAMKQNLKGSGLIGW